MADAPDLEMLQNRLNQITNTNRRAAESQGHGHRAAADIRKEPLFARVGCGVILRARAEGRGLRARAAARFPLRGVCGRS
jgi:hypothetical protein